MRSDTFELNLSLKIHFEHSFWYQIFSRHSFKHPTIIQVGLCTCLMSEINIMSSMLCEQFVE